MSADTARDGTSREARTRVTESAGTTVVRAIMRPIGLVVVALAIVLALAVGIPWLIDLVW